MVEYEILNDSPVLKFNFKHQRFNETGEMIKAGDKISGEKKEIQGLRRGVPFKYRVTQFNHNNTNKFIYTNNLKNNKMETDNTEGSVEVNSNASGETVIAVNDSKTIFPNLTESFITILGAAGGYFYAKKKGKSLVMGTVVGAVAGYAVAKLAYPQAIKIFKK